MANNPSFHLQCFTCGEWYSTSDVSIALDGIMPYMTNYEYCCKVNCDSTEKLIKKPASFIQVGITAIANLMSLTGGTHFDLEKDIYPFVWENWDTICTKRSKSGNWKSNLSTKLTTETIIFSEKDGKFGLVDQDLTTIGPRRYESKTMPQKNVSKVKRKSEASQVGPSTTKKSKIDTVPPQKGLSHGYPLEHPYNKDGYRYILAEKDPHSSIMLDSDDMAAGRPIPPEIYRPWIPPTVLLSLNDRASQIKVRDSRLTVVGEKGYCMIRGTHGISEGTWYFEVHVDDMANDGALRLGWSQSLATLQAPCGYDKLSYSWRSRKGTVFHQSRGKHYSEGYGTGDTLGFLIYLPPSEKGRALPQTFKDKALIKFKNFFYFEEKDETVEEFEKTLVSLKNSKIIFYKNGISEGTAFTDIYNGMYYPSISLYKSVTVTANFGPDFHCPPNDIKIQPMSDAADLASVRQTVSEMLFHVESKVLSRTTAQYPSNYKFSQQLC